MVRAFDDESAYHIEYPQKKGWFSLDKKSGDIWASYGDRNNSRFISADLIVVILMLAAETTGNPCLHASGVRRGRNDFIRRQQGGRKILTLLRIDGAWISARCRRHCPDRPKKPAIPGVVCRIADQALAGQNRNGLAALAWNRIHTKGQIRQQEKQHHPDSAEQRNALLELHKHLEIARILPRLKLLPERLALEEHRKARERKQRAECDDPRVAVGPSVSSECGA